MYVHQILHGICQATALLEHLNYTRRVDVTQSSHCIRLIQTRDVEHVNEHIVTHRLSILPTGRTRLAHHGPSGWYERHHVKSKEIWIELLACCTGVFTLSKKPRILTQSCPCPNFPFSAPFSALRRKVASIGPASNATLFPPPPSHVVLASTQYSRCLRTPCDALCKMQISGSDVHIRWCFPSYTDLCSICPRHARSTNLGTFRQHIVGWGQVTHRKQGGDVSENCRRR